MEVVLFILVIDPLIQILDTAIRHGLLHKLCGRETILRSSLYSDDAAIFVAPLEEDMKNLSTLAK
jgi:hypothetical protein